MPVLIHSARRGQNPAVIFPSALLVEGSAPKPLLNTGFHSVATRSPNASEGWNKSFHPIVFGATVKQRSPGS